MIETLHKKTKEIVSHPLMIIIFLYTAANIFMLLNNGWYWDDWCLSSPEGIKDICIGVGIPFMAPIHSWLINSTAYPALLYHITTGVIEILGIVLFYKCLLMLNINRSHTLMLTLFFALLPYNQAKITMVCFMYTIGFSLFLLAVFLFIYFVRKNNLIARLFSLLLFFSSFMFLPSTLILALAFFLFMAILSLKLDVEFKLYYYKLLLQRLLTWADFILIPFIFWVFRAFFLKPTGIYATIGYREFSFHSVFLMPIKLIITFIQNFIGLATSANALSISNIYALLFVALLIALFIFLRNYKIEKLGNRQGMLYIGLYFFVAGAFAYTMVGLSPLFDGFNSRHQILLRFGSTFLLFYLISLIYSEKAQKLISLTFISLFFVATISCQIQFQKSWFKQIALEKIFSREKLLGEGVNFIIIDNTKDYNEFRYNEVYRYYCYTGILKKTFGTQTRFAIDSESLNEDFIKYNPQLLIEAPSNNMIDCANITTFSYSVIIDHGSLSLTIMQTQKMLFQYYFDRTKFDSTIDKVLLLSVLPNNMKYK